LVSRPLRFMRFQYSDSRMAAEGGMKPAQAWNATRYYQDSKASAGALTCQDHGATTTDPHNSESLACFLRMAL
jgi:hypothetical protein